MIDLARIEAVLDDEAVATALASIEARLPVGVRPRQLCVRTFVGLGSHHKNRSPSVKGPHFGL